jgi:uncharacterized protein YndB with AHSA1/START domain
MRNHVVAKGAPLPFTRHTVERLIELPLPVEDAWELLVDDDLLQDWLASEVDLVPEPGAPLRVRDADGTERVGIVGDVEPGSRLAFRWWPRTAPDDESEVVLEITEAVDGSRLVVTETFRAPATARPAWGGRLQACAAAAGALARA